MKPSDDIASLMIREYGKNMLLWTALLTLALSYNSADPLARGWRGIIPLQSTRADVERLWGSPGGECRCFYTVEDAAVYVDYSNDRCRGVIPGWNVQKDTVLRLTVLSKTQTELSDLNLDLTRFKVRTDDTFTQYLSNKQEGIEYKISPEGLVSSISYLPSIQDQPLRCKGFPPEDGSTFGYLAFDKYGDVSFEIESARLDNFAVMLSRSPRLTAYVVVYAGKVACPRESFLRARRARDYLIKRRGIDRQRVKAIDGGYREDPSVQLYALPADAEAPAAVPTVSASDVRIVREGCKRLVSP